MAEWTLLYHNEVIDTSDNGVFSIPPEYGVGETFYIVHNYQEADEQRIKYVRSKTCCDCDSIKYTKVYGANYVGNAEQTFNPAIKLGSISFKDTKCDGNVTLSAVCETVGEMTLNVVGKDVYLTHIKANTTGNPRALNYYATVNGEKCGGDFVAQQCWRATDNGTDYYLDDKGHEIKENSAMLLCSNAGSTEGDTIKVSTMKLISASASTGNDSYTALTINQTSTGNIVNTANWSATFEGAGGAGNWLKVYNHETGECGYGSIFYESLTVCPGDDSSINGYRSVVLVFSTDDSEISMNCNPAISHRGEECCKQWEVEIKQCKQGLAWYSPKAEDGRGHSRTSIPLSGPTGIYTERYRCNP